MKSTRFTERLNFEKELKSTVMGKRIPTVNYSLTKEIGTYDVNGLALVEREVMPASVLAGAKSKQVIKTDIIPNKNDFITPKQISIESSKF